MIVPLVVELLRPTSVVDVGCGSGAWLAEFKRLGATEVLGIDGPRDAGSLLVGPHEFMAWDLSEPLPLDRTFDMALSLEVAEHLPEASAAAFVAQLVRLAPAVLFSAAVPHQGGTGHVNEQWPEYWARLFAEHGYTAVDCVRPQVWANPHIEFWYAQNTLLFAPAEAVAGDERLAAAAAATRPDALSRVHPALYLAKVSRPELTLDAVASGVRSALRRALRAGARRVSTRAAGAPAAAPRQRR